jgi:tryptophan-rich sensory protein
MNINSNGKSRSINLGVKTKRGLLNITTMLFFVLHAEAVTFYVSASNSVPVSPFAGWSTAATNIQDAIDAATNGDLVIVTNGVYQFGGTAMAGNLTNRVALNKAVTVQSVNGPWATTIQGLGATNGTAAVRCAWLTNGAVLQGFTLQGGATRSSGDGVTLECGGGVWCASSNAIVVNCVIQSNNAASQGGGIYQGSLKNSFVKGNVTVSSSGGAAANTVMTSCTVVSNLTGGVVGGNYTNSILYFNQNFNDLNAGPINYCCVTPSPGGVGNITAVPQLFGDGVHLTVASPCIGGGTNLVTGTDIFGQAWANPPAIGCAEKSSAPYVIRPQIQLTGSPVGFTVGNASFIGQPPLTFAWLKDGLPLTDNGHFSPTQTTNLAASGVSFADAGNYQFVVSNAFGVVTSAVATLVIHTVDVNGSNPIAPYSTWATAATNIQDTITASVAGDVVLVTNGLYAGGGKSMDGVITNRVSLDKAILVQSVNGPNASVIQGAWDPTSTNGAAAVRCAWLTNSAILSGFTLRGGATRASPTSGQAVNGGGVWGAITNVSRSSIAIVANCVIVTNAASNLGGGAYGVALNGCTIASNIALGGGATTGTGGGAEACNLKNCFISSNVANNTGGGADNCNLVNCALVKNSSYYNGGAANSGSLVNCTVTANIASGYSSGYGAAVYGAALTNCIVFGNFSRTSYPNTNYASCMLVYCCTDPLPAGTGNFDVNPQLLADGEHLAATSPCIGAGTASFVSGTDIDGQPWNTPPSVGCDEWQPAPVISAPLTYQVNSPAHGLTFNVIVAGQSPFTFFWSKDGSPIQDDGHHSNSSTANLVVNNFGPADAGVYQVTATNAFGVVTSQVAQVVIHAVDAAGQNPLAPYSAWATAATNIQDAISAASAGDIVLVTNGIYATGGKVMAGDLTNRVALDRAVIVMSVNGCVATVIQGAWDSISTNGPGAVRCVYVADGALLNGFTLQNGATRATGDGFSGGPLESGGGVWCNSTNGTVVNCVLTNNNAIYGGGIMSGTLNNSLVFDNGASYGGGTYNSILNNCTVVNNFSSSPFVNRGAGTYGGNVRNSIVVGNYDAPPNINPDNYNLSGFAQFTYSCTSPSLLGTGNLSVTPQFLDSFHIAATSPCRGAGSGSYANGSDLDGEAWASPPSMGCDEIITSNLVGPLSVNILAAQTNLLVNRYGVFSGNLAGRVAGVVWSFGDGLAATNPGPSVSHQWTNSGDYSVTFTAYNNDNPAGVATNVIVHVQPLSVPQLQSAILLTNGFQFEFAGQFNANYTVQYATNLAPPVSWQTLQVIYFNNTNLVYITDSATPNGTRFYRVLAQ